MAVLPASTCTFAVLLACIGAATAQFRKANDSSAVASYRTRPELFPPVLNITINKPDLVQPGHIFFAPYHNLDAGPYIYDNDGELVWSGAADMGPQTAHYPHVCQYKEADHLCFFSGYQWQGYSRGRGVIMNNHYQIVKTVETAGADAVSDMHEFRLVNGTTALMTIYQTVAKDLTGYNLGGGMGYVLEGRFQEVDIETGELLFEWRSLDHVDPYQSFVMPGTTMTSGDGRSVYLPWDYFHINSVDKNKDGNYLISARHASAVYCVSGVDGHIIWQLGGLKPTVSSDFVFSFQHDARWLSTNATHSLISIFDNASDGFNKTSNFSSGIIVSIDHTSSTATVLTRHGAPGPGLATISQANMQLLPNDSVFFGWGDYCRVSEHLADGTPVFYAEFAPRNSIVMNYRAVKHRWTGHPLTRPSVWTFSNPDHNSTAVYASWNGATEVQEWRCFTALSSTGPWTEAGTYPRKGFETMHLFPSSVDMEWVFVQALDHTGRELSRSPVVKTLIPSAELRPFCDAYGCEPAFVGPAMGSGPRTGEHEGMTEGMSGYDTVSYIPVLEGEEKTVRHGQSDPKWKAFGSGIMIFAPCLGAAVLMFYVVRRLLMTTGMEMRRSTRTSLVQSAQQGLVRLEAKWMTSSVRRRVLGNYAVVSTSEEGEMTYTNRSPLTSVFPS